MGGDFGTLVKGRGHIGSGCGVFACRILAQLSAESMSIYFLGGGHTW